MNRFVIKRGDKYVYFDKKHRVVLTTLLSKADLWDYSKAVLTIENSIPKKERSHYQVVELSQKENNIVKKQEKVNVSSGSSQTYTVSELCDNFQILAEGIDKLLPHLSDCKTEFSRRLSETDMKICDILHRLETPKGNGSEFNACEMFKLADLLRKLRRERRIIKNNIAKIDCLLSVVKTNENVSQLDVQFKKIESAKYHPRILTELFSEEVGSC